MFARLAAISTLAFAALVAAGNCNTGSMQCCESVHDSDSAVGSTALAALGVNVQGLTGMVGIKCSPISAVGVGGGNACSASPVCCQNNNVGGLISIGCAPVLL